VLAVQPHPDGVFTAAVALPPDAFTDTVIGETVYEHGTPASVTVTALSAMVTMPLCAVVEAFAATDRFTVPGPVPFATSNPIHPDALLTIHPHPAGVVTETGLVPPEAENPTLVDESAYVHGTPALNVNGFERLLRDDPVGPMAATSALYVVPWTGVVVTYEDSGSVIVPVLSGAGSPRSVTMNGAVAPAAYQANW
jgi:hypothetical protein